VGTKTSPTTAQDNNTTEKERENEMSIWDDPTMKVNDDYVKFENPGDTITGRIIAASIHHWDDGSASPKLLLDVDGEEKSVTAGQVRLKAALAEKRPEPGDVITITFTDVEKRPGGKTLKHFDVTIVRGGAAAAAPSPASAPVAAAAVFGEDALLAAGLTEEQRAALAALSASK